MFKHLNLEIRKDLKDDSEWLWPTEDKWCWRHLTKSRFRHLPKKIAERQRKQQELLRLQLVSAPTRADGLSKLRDKRHPVRQQPSSPGGKRIAERRAARMQFILLCVVLGIILLLLWRSLPS